MARDRDLRRRLDRYAAAWLLGWPARPVKLGTKDLPPLDPADLRAGLDLTPQLLRRARARRREMHCASLLTAAAHLGALEMGDNPFARPRVVDDLAWEDDLGALARALRRARTSRAKGPERSLRRPPRPRGTAHVVLAPFTGSGSKEGQIRDALRRRWTRVRRKGLAARLARLDLAWIVMSQGDMQQERPSPAFLGAGEERQFEILEKLKTDDRLPAPWLGMNGPAVALANILDMYLTPTPEQDVRLRARARRLAGAAPDPRLTRLLDKGERDLLARAAGLLPLGGPRTVHAADELWADLHAKAPWMAEASSLMWRAMRGALAEGRGPLLPPVLLHGPPGLGKTTLPRALARLAGLPIVEIDAGLSSSAFRVAGADRTWGSSAPGEPLRAVLDHRVPNVVVIVNEVDRIGAGSQSARGTTSSMTDALLTLLDRESARRFTCPYYRMTFDLSAVTFVLTANDLSAVDPVLLSRLRRVEIPRPGPAHIEAIVRGGLADLDPDLAETAAGEVAARWRAAPDMTLRQVDALLARLRAAASAPRLH